MADISIIHEGSTDYYVKDAAGRLALAEVVNKGAKNLFDIQHPSTVRSTSYNATADGGVELTCSNAAWTQYIITDIPVESGREYAFTLYVDEISGTNTFRAYIRDNDSTGNVLFDSNNISTVKTINATITSDSGKIWVGIYINNSATAKTASAKIRAMLCTKAEWDISQVYVAYGKTNAELTSDISALSTENTRQETEIGVVANAGAKNLLNPDDYIKNSTGGLTITETGTGTYKITGTPSGTVDIFTTQSGKFGMMYGLEAGKTYTISGLPEGNGLLCRIDVSKNNSGSWDAQIISNLTLPQTFTVPSDATGLYIRYRVTTSAMIPSGGISLEPMIRPAAITDPTYEPYALPNPTLTPAAIKAVDEGAKNLFPNYATSQTVGGVTFTVSPDGSITSNGIKENNDWFMLSTGNTIKAGTYVLYDGLPADTTDCQLIVTTGRSMGTAIMATAANARPKTVTLTSDYEGLYYAIRIASGKTVNNLTFKPMICTAQDWAVSKKFVPYAPTNRELYEEKIGIEDVFGVRPQIADNTDLNTLQTIGKYVCGGLAKAQTLLNCPMQGAFIMLVDAVGALTRLIQRIYGFDTNTGKVLIYIRALTINGWGSWYKFEGTEVT